MSFQFPSEEWIKALMDQVNQSEAYRAAAKDWEGDFNFVIKFPNGTPDAVLYMDLWHGQCRAAYRVNGTQERPPEFVVEGRLLIWRKVVEKRLDAIMALVTRQLLIDQKGIGFWTYTLSNGSTIQRVSPWVSFTIIYLVASTILVVMAIRRMRKVEA